MGVYNVNHGNKNVRHA
uniref:Uncharacterized protein n=1 Tax=Arundo donax TaxID=35708 RepID=A0A0A9CND7_ARUDO